MHTVKFTQIDGLDVVVGFGVPTVDPVATKREAYRSLGHHDGYEALADDYYRIRKELTDFENSKFKELQAGEINRATYKLLCRKATTDKQPEVKAIIHAMIALEEKAFHDNIQFFNPGPNEALLAENEYERLISIKVAANQKLLTSGKVIDDLRGRECYRKLDSGWHVRRIEELGDTKQNGEVYKEDLTDEQLADYTEWKETERIKGLSDLERLTELQQRCHVVEQAAALRMCEFMLQDHPDAKGEARQWLTEEITQLKKQYHMS